MSIIRLTPSGAPSNDFMFTRSINIQSLFAAKFLISYEPDGADS